MSALACNLVKIIYCLLISYTKINHWLSALVIISSLQLASAQCIVSQQINARADLFLIRTHHHHHHIRFRARFPLPRVGQFRLAICICSMVL